MVVSYMGNTTRTLQKMKKNVESKIRAESLVFTGVTDEKQV